MVTRPLQLLYIIAVLAAALFSADAFLAPHATVTSRRSFSLSAIENQKPKTKKGGKKTNKSQRNLPRSNALKSNKPRTPTFGPRQVLTEYDINRNPSVNAQRLSSAMDCPHFNECSGCSVAEQVGQIDIIQSAKLFFSSTSLRRRRRDVVEQGLPWSVEESDDGFYKVVVPSQIKGWRTQAKLAVAPKSSTWAKDGCEFGLYRRGTHNVLSIPDCVVHHRSINKAVHALVSATSRVGTAAFNADSREGGLRYVQFQVERATGKICLTLVWNAESLKDTQPALSRLVKELNKSHPELWHSMWCHCNDSVGNNIFSRNARRWHRLMGPEFIREPIPACDTGWLYFTPLAFRQGNLDGFDILAMDVARAVQGGSKVCELYAGVGVLGLTALAYHAAQDKPLAWIRCSDENPANPRCFHRAVDSLPPSVNGRDRIKPRDEDDGMTLAELATLMESGKGSPFKDDVGEKASYMVASAAKALHTGQALGASTLIVDPPRKGLEEEVLQELCKAYNPNQPYVESTTLLSMADEKVNWVNDVQTLIYVSCGFDALARDAEALLSSNGGWMLESATGYVLFPGSDHVETLCIFKRN